jgi:excisionase family DNA binding protein
VGKKANDPKITYCVHCGTPRISKLYSLNTIAEMTDTTVASWRRRVLDREIPYVKIGKSVRISADALHLYMETIPSLIDEAQSILIDN